jgi:hypothetical protein
MSLLQSFIRRVERFLGRYGMAATRFGKCAANDPNFVFDLRQGRKPNPDLIEAVDRWMREFREETKREKRAGADGQKCAADRANRSAA